MLFPNSGKDSDKDLIKQDDKSSSSSDVDLFDSFDNYNEDLKKSIKLTESSLRDLFRVSNVIASDVFNKSTNLYDDFKSFFIDVDNTDDGGAYRQNDDDAFLKDVKNLDKFIGSVTGGLISNPFNINYKPLNDKSTGYWAYPSPSSEIYDACKEKNGLSVWDEQGYWRCLFPKAIIPLEKLGKVLSKEDVLEDSNNKNGLFFQDFNKYLDWKSNMKKVLREERLKKIQEAKTLSKPSSSSNLDDFDDLKKSEFASVNSSQIHNDKKLTGQKDYLMTYESNGVKTETRKRYEYYEDGSSAVKETIKKFNKNEDNSQPSVEEHIKEFPARKSGWFWDNSDDDN